MRGLGNESLGARIRRRRRELGVTQAELAARAGVNQGYISEIERGRARPRRRTMDALVMALDMPHDAAVEAAAQDDAGPALQVVTLPLLASIPRGRPADSPEPLQGFPVLRQQWSPDYYCLRVGGDTMEPTLKPGDVVLVHHRTDAAPEHVQGRICACVVEDEPVLRRLSVERRQDRHVVVLRGDNPRVEPIRIEERRQVSIQGIVLRLLWREL